MTAPELLSSAIAFLLGSVLQSAVGFGAGMLSVPLLIWTGVALPKAVSMMLGVVTLHAGYNCYLARSEIRWGPIIPMTLIRWGSSPIGVWLLINVLQQSQTTAKRAVGAVLLVSLLLNAKTNSNPRTHLHSGWMWLAGMSSGILGASVGMGGPPLILYALSHDWTNERTKSYLWTLFMLGSPMIALILWWRLGNPAIHQFLIGIAHAPVVWLGSTIGLRLSRLNSRETLRRISIATLAVIALVSMFAPRLAG
ncbi:MAG TPA: sulfite exporter TauE/SafE family protein [Polyangiaceae bacterium]|nr:sulfite exporter TauE/SafE family protein [Polyangiaceae bacterium]